MKEVEENWKKVGRGQKRAKEVERELNERSSEAKG